MGTSTVRDVHVHYNVRGPNSRFKKKRKTRTILTGMPRRSSLHRCVGKQFFFVSIISSKQRRRALCHCVALTIPFGTLRRSSLCRCVAMLRHSVEPYIAM